MKWLNAALIVKYNFRLVASLHEAKDLAKWVMADWSRQ